ncbi:MULTISPECIES: hypothetical protein [Pseudomonas chlororaphis group]|uniref:hypothetical protein n=1 Tax=Pseudomonas chlororaphis group TaxID=136842 RepID=UPI002097737C|nr:MULTISPECIES: hypothetical protein [Pseudomonas chlororaphis group]MCO7577815.1 hypothetical protein [Pseudomonas protegens]MCO7584190.1 hypothetical protein [Pseudomonas chlororaphis]MCO7601198.1 hypothetical protein [Pseudomonas chlororaphis]
MCIHDDGGNFRAQKMILAATDLAAAFIGTTKVCPIDECLPALTNQTDYQIYDLRQPAQAVLHIGLVSSQYRIAKLETEIRAMRLALSKGAFAPDLNSLNLFPSEDSLFATFEPDLQQVETTGQMPQLRSFQQRLHNAWIKSLIADGGRALGFIQHFPKAK